MKMINRMLSILSNQKATPKKVLSTPKRKATSSTPKAKKRFFERSDITTSFSTPSEMCSKFGFEAVVLLCFATQHVPIMFPNRLTYIRNIVNSGKRTFTSEEILDSVQSVESWKDTPWPLSGYSYHRTLWEISQHTSTSHMLFLAPPVDSCLHCGGKVYASDSSSHATVFTLGFGPLPALKCTLRCRECSSRYNLCDYRIPNIGTKYYPSNCVTPYVEVSTCTYFEKNVHEFMCESSNHGIVSASAFTEIYNSVYSTDHNFTRNFYESKLSASNSFKDPPAEDHTPVYLPNYEKEHSSSTADINCIEQELRSTGYQVTMSRKNAINSFFNGELEKEVRERQMVEEVTFQKKDDRKVLMNKIDELRRAELYPHTETECSSICKERGCENLRIIDGNWKLCVQHCLYSIPMEIDGQPLLNFPSVCTQEPQAGSVFCDDHFQLLKKKEIPVSKPDFLRCAGIDGPPKNPEERKEYDSKLAAFCRKLDGKDNISKSAAYYQGTEQLLKKLGPSAVNDVPEDLCNKDTGEKSHMRQRARGHVVVVSGGGNILYWNPVYNEAFYRFDDLQNAFCYSQALNNSFGNGGGLFCTFQPRDIIMHCGQLDEDWRSEGNTPKTLVTKPGLQPNSNILVLNPDHYVNTKGENVPVEDCNFVWLPDYPASPSMELAHYINTDTKLEPLRQFVLKAEEVCANNIGPTLLAISCMYLQCHFKKLMDLVGHYNIPLLYSPHTQVGKTLAASCASNLIGAQNLYSRCTLAYLTGRVTGSTLPFVWDDPTSPNDVVQLAVDLGNGASRGAGPPKTKRGKDNPPTTGCIVTANFSLCNIDRAGTRTVPLMFSPLNKDKQPGEGLELQEMAKEASCAFPLIVGLFEQIKKDTVASQTTLVKKLLPMLDLRLQEGLALPLLYLRLILNELKLYRVMPAVISYIQNQLFQELSGRPTTDQDESTLNTLITRISTIVHNKDLAEEASDHIRVMPDYIAIRPSEISKLLDMPEDQTRKILNHPGCTRGQVRLQTGNKKCYKVFKDLLTNNVVKKLEEALKVGQVEEEEAEVVEDIPSDDELVFDRERPADRPAILEETDDEEVQQQQDPQPQPHQPQQPEPHVPEEPLPEITQKGQQKRKKLTLLPLVVKKKAITNSQRSSSRSSKGVTSKLTDYYI